MSNIENAEVKATCRVVVSKEPGTDGGKFCDKEATVMWPILADDDVTVLDYLFACDEHDKKYEEGHTLVVQDLRGLNWMFQKPKDGEELKADEVDLNSEPKIDIVTEDGDASHRLPE